MCTVANVFQPEDIQFELLKFKWAKQSEYGILIDGVETARERIKAAYRR